MRLDDLFEKKQENLLSIYCTAGYPELDSLPQMLEALEASGVDFVEVGIPYSDPLADGATIQESNARALANGITIDLIFEQLAQTTAKLPKVMMSYFNPVLQYGMARFLERCKAVGVSGMILPDLPVELYQAQYQPLFEAAGISMIFLISPQTSTDRLERINAASSSFIYAVSSSSTTGKTAGLGGSDYLRGLKNLGLDHPIMVGFNISRAEDLALVQQHAAGGIIGSAFIRHIGACEGPLEEAVRSFVAGLRLRRIPSRT